MFKIKFSLVAVCAAAICLAWTESARAEECAWTAEHLKALKAQVDNNTICVDFDKLRYEIDSTAPMAETCLQKATTSEEDKLKIKSVLEQLSGWIAKNCNIAAPMPPASCEQLCTQSGGSWTNGKCTCSPDKNLELRGPCICAQRGTNKRAPQNPQTPQQLPPVPPPPNCLTDHDGDGIPDCKDNCIVVRNPDQVPSSKYPGLGAACDDMTDTEIQRRFQFVEGYVKQVADALKEQGLDPSAATKLLAWLRDHKDKLATKADIAQAVRMLNLKISATSSAIQWGFKCVAAHNIPTYTFVESDGLLATGECQPDPYWLDIAAERLCQTRTASAKPGVFYFWIPKLDDLGRPTGQGECRENRDLAQLFGRIQEIENAANEALRKATKAERQVGEQSRSFAIPSVGAYALWYQGLERAAAGGAVAVRIPNLGGSEHWRLKLEGRGGGGTGSTGTWGGVVAAEAVAGAPDDPVRFSIAFGPSLMNWTKLRSDRRETPAGALGVEVTPGIQVRLSPKCGLHLGAPLGVNRYWGADSAYGISAGGSLDLLCSYEWGGGESGKSDK